MTTERLVIEVTERGARVVGGKLKGIGTDAQKAGAGVQFLKSQLSGLVVGLVGIGAATAALATSINLLRTFGQQISTVGAISGATTQEFEALTDRARKLGAMTRFTGAQAAEGMVLLSRAGFDTAETMKAAGETLLLAQAGALDLASAAGITAATVRGFRLDVEDTSVVVDVLAKAAASANTDVFQLGEGLKFAAPVAAGLGVSLQETTAAVSALSDAGLQATLAGTGLRRVMAELESPSKKSEKILKELGVTAAEVRVSQVGLTTALERLRDAGIDTGTALEFFGQRGGPAFEVLSSNIPRVKELTTALENAEGTAQRIAEVMDDNLNGAFLRARSATEDLIFELSSLGFEDALIDNLNEGAQAIRDLSTAIKTANELFPLEPALAKIFTGVAGPAVGIRGIFTRGEELVATFESAAGFFSSNERLRGLQKQNELLRKIGRELEKKQEIPALRGSFLETQREFGPGTAGRPTLPEGIPIGQPEVPTMSVEELRQIILKAAGAIRRATDPRFKETVELLNEGSTAVSLLGEQFEVVGGKIKATNDEALQLPATVEATGDAVDDLVSRFPNLQNLGQQAFDGIGLAAVDAAAGADNAFANFFANLLRQLANLAFQEALLNIPGLGSRLGANVRGGFQFGGPFQAGDTAFVGERGVERVTFGAPGRVDPIPAAAPPNISVVNITDPDEVNSVIGSGSADRVIINRLAANPDLVRQALPRTS
jgi:TP901 family phage tail tape measure protein